MNGKVFTQTKLYLNPRKRTLSVFRSFFFHVPRNLNKLSIKYQSYPKSKKIDASPES